MCMHCRFTKGASWNTLTFDFLERPDIRFHGLRLS